MLCPSRRQTRIQYSPTNIRWSSACVIICYCFQNRMIRGCLNYEIAYCFISLGSVRWYYESMMYARYEVSYISLEITVWPSLCLVLCLSLCYLALIYVLCYCLTDGQNHLIHLNDGSSSMECPYYIA